MAANEIDRMVNKGVSGADNMKIQTAEALEDAARKLRSVDIATHGEDVKQILHDAESKINEHKAACGLKIHEMEAEYHHHVEPVENVIIDHPIPAVLVAAGLGLLAGMVIRKTRD